MPRPPTTLLLVPTEGERHLLGELGGLPGDAPELVGFGPVAAAARTAGLLASLEPQRVLLVGIAGSLDPARLPPGSASDFARVVLDGVGAGHGLQALAPSALGFPQWPGAPGRVDESLPLAGQAGVEAGVEDVELLSVCAASADAAQCDERRSRFPRAVAEDMEGFGVALACHLAGIPLRIVRGISNPVGERDRRAWRIRAALHGARTLALEVLAQEHWSVTP